MGWTSVLKSGAAAKVGSMVADATRELMMNWDSFKGQKWWAKEKYYLTYSNGIGKLSLQIRGNKHFWLPDGKRLSGHDDRSLLKKIPENGVLERHTLEL